MAVQPKPAPKPAPPPNPSPNPPKPADPKPEAARSQSTTIGAKPDDPNDPQAKKFEPHATPPRWEEPKPGEDADLNPDGPTIAETQRETSAAIEAEGMSNYLDELDERPPEERGAHKQVPGVAPPTKRS